MFSFGHTNTNLLSGNPAGERAQSCLVRFIWNKQFDLSPLPRKLWFSGGSGSNCGEMADSASRPATNEGIQQYYHTKIDELQVCHLNRDSGVL